VEQSFVLELLFLFFSREKKKRKREKKFVDIALA
jgi:hypothetical protein